MIAFWCYAEEFEEEVEGDTDGAIKKGKEFNFTMYPLLNQQLFSMAQVTRYTKGYSAADFEHRTDKMIERNTVFSNVFFHYFIVFS